MNFDTAFHRLLGHEGGYIDDPNDPGGETNWGVSKRSYPDLDIKNLTVDQAKEIYRADYWDAVRADHMPAWARFDLFDGAVNSGPQQSIKWMQFALGVTQDGIIGVNTIRAIHDAKPYKTLLKYNAARLMFMSKLNNWKYHGKGWAMRIAKNLFRHGS